jgi:hypothetical protein
MREWFDLALKYLALIAAFVSVIGYFTKVHIENGRLAAAKTEAYIAEYTSGRLLDDTQAVDFFWRHNIQPLFQQKKVWTPADLSRVFQVIILTNERYANYERSLNHILLHFDLVAFCSRQGLCDLDLVRAFYCDEYKALRLIYDFNRNHYTSQGVTIGSQGMGYFDDKCPKPSADAGRIGTF